MVEELLFFIEVLVGGLLAGTMYSLVALGFVLIFKASATFNFSQGAMVFSQFLLFVVSCKILTYLLYLHLFWQLF